MAIGDAFRRGSTTGRQGAGEKANNVVTIGDDVGICNIGAYSRGMMAGRTAAAVVTLLDPPFLESDLNAWKEKAS